MHKKYNVWRGGGEGMGKKHELMLKSISSPEPCMSCTGMRAVQLWTLHNCEWKAPYMICVRFQPTSLRASPTKWWLWEPRRPPPIVKAKTGMWEKPRQQGGGDACNHSSPSKWTTRLDKEYRVGELCAEEWFYIHRTQVRVSGYQKTQATRLK